MEGLIRLSLRRPVTIAAFYVLVVALAAAALVRLPVALLPSLRFPTLVVWTPYPDVPPERVETVTEHVEKAVAGIAGLKHLSSRSQLGGSLVRLDFDWQSDPDLALLEVREQLDRLVGILPRKVERPVLLRLDPSERPIMMLSVRPSTTANLLGLNQVAREVVARRLEQIDGVARVRTTGGYDKEIEIEVDPGKMAAHRISLGEISEALQAANVTLSGGMIRRGPFRYAVEIRGEFTNPEQIGATVIARQKATPRRLRDVATIRETVADRRGLVRMNGREALLLLVERRLDANTVRTAREVRRVLTELVGELPGVRLEVVVDESEFIAAAITGVGKAVLLGGLFAMAVLITFLRRPRALVAVGVAIPLSLAITLVLFELCGITFNLISLGGLALGVGMLLDNAIIVVENITRLKEQGMVTLTAVARGTAEVAPAITASTVTTLAVFVPLCLVEGVAGRLFRDQSLAVVCSLLASLLVAQTAVPLLARWDRVSGGGTVRAPRWRRAYEGTLSWCLEHRRGVVLVSAVLLAATGILAWHLPRELVPHTDQGRLVVSLEVAPESDLSLLSEQAAALEAKLLSWPEIEHVLADLGQRDEARLEIDPRPPYRGELTLVLRPGESAPAVAARLHAWAAPAGLELQVRPVRTQLETLLASAESDLDVVLSSSGREPAEAAAEAAVGALRRLPQLANVAPGEAHRIPAYRLRLRREALVRFGLAPPTLAAYLEAAARGHEVTALRTVNEEIPIVLRLERKSSIDHLLQERIPTPQGLLPLEVFLAAERITLPASLARDQQSPVVRLVADVAPGHDLQSAVGAIDKTLSGLLPATVRAQVSGANQAFRTSAAAVGWTLLLSVLLVYLILAAHFESFLQPLIILTTVPLAAAGVALALALTGQSVNLMSLTGCVVLVGIVVNDAIVKVDLINQRRRDGLPLKEAVESASHDRARPILMTTATTVLGLLPLALQLGQAAELRAPLAIALGGGLVSSTLLTLLIVPVLYALMAAISGTEHSAARVRRSTTELSTQPSSATTLAYRF